LPQQPAPADPVSCVSFDEAQQYAERVGKRLPTEAEYEYAATEGGRRKVPWTSPQAAPDEWTFGPAGATGPDTVTWAGSQVFGLYSNVAEWTESRFTLDPALATDLGPLPEWQKQTRIVRGGQGSVMTRTPSRAEWLLGPCQRVSATPDTQQPGLGFRCVRSARPRLSAEDF
jgi:formylglycine-generating enzyme required for sulfatase activity